MKDALTITAIGTGFVLVGCVLYVIGNRLFGRKTGGKRLVVFLAGIACVSVACFIFQQSQAKNDTSEVFVILGAAAFILGMAFTIMAFAPDKKVDQAFEAVLKLF